ncbi:hypothetical protein TNCV_3361971 [Trichonephila clavipes]|nr:hypothetical protein TNCV_3361971 [Trichonephila clavipes]
MPLRRFVRQYEQLSQFEMGRIIDMMEAAWSARRESRQLGRSDSVVRRLVFGTLYPRDVIYMKTRLRTPSSDQSPKRLQHRKKCMRTANCFIGCNPDICSTLTR